MDFQELSAIRVTWFNGFWILNVVISHGKAEKSAYLHRDLLLKSPWTLFEFLWDFFGDIHRSAGHQRVPKSYGYLNQSFPGVKKGGMKGEVKRGKGVGKGTGLEGERGGKNESKRVGGKGSASTPEKLWTWHAYDLGTLQRPFKQRSIITLRLLSALNSEDRGLKVRFSLATIAFETFELILFQMLSSQGKKRTFKPLSSLFSAFSNLKEFA